jgi:glycerate kinase
MAVVFIIVTNTTQEKRHRLMKNFILIPDSFKGTMSSMEICTIMEKAIKATYPDAHTISLPVADGGEGSVDSFLQALGGEKITLKATGPYREPVEGFYGILPGNVAVIEMAATAGLPLVQDRLDPSLTTTYGVGELMIDAAKRGCKTIIIGLGGSATNDGGCGAAAACGVRFLDSKGNEFVPTGSTLDKVASIDKSKRSSLLEGIQIKTMCDIDNPYYGKTGAAYIFGPQKGADEKMVESLDAKMQALCKVMERDCNVNVQTIPGSGAAGGMGGGMIAFFDSKLQMGIETVLDTVEFDKKLESADAVFTGEGKIDGQSLRGKVVIGIARRAKKKHVPVFAIVGDIGDDVAPAYDMGVTGIYSINRVAKDFSKVKGRAKNDMYLTMDNLMRTFKRLGL